MSSVRPWTAVALQVRDGYVTGTARGEGGAFRSRLLDGYEALIGRAADEGPCDLVCFPEYMFGTAEPDLSGVISMDGPEVARLQKIAQDRRIFIAAGAYMRDPRFPGRYFNTSFVLDRSGEVVLTYFRIFTYHSVSPHDFWQRFLDVVGIEGAFPVAKTELGNLAMLSSMEMMYPEVGRAYLLRGAEVLLHLTAESMVDISAKRIRAAENMMAVISANVPNTGANREMEVASAIIDPGGRVLARCQEGEPGLCRAEIDLPALRRLRADVHTGAPPHPVNYLSRLRAEVVRDLYNSASIYPSDSYVEGAEVTSAITPQTHPERLEAARSQLVRMGLIQEP